MSTLVTLLVLWILLRLAGPWFMAYGNGLPLSLIELVGMRIRGSDAHLIVATAIALNKLGEPVPLIDLEVAYLSLPDTQHNMTEMMRSVRPQLVARLEADVQARAARSSTGP